MVWVRSVHSGARGRRFKFFFPAGADTSISRGFCVRPVFFFIRTYDFFVFCSGAQPRQQVAAPCREYAYPQLTSKLQPALSPSSSSRQHPARVARTRCATASCLPGTGISEPALDHPARPPLPLLLLPLLLLAVCDYVKRAQPRQ